MSDALIEGVSGAIGAITALVSTYPLLTVRLHQVLQGRVLPVATATVCVRQAAQARTKSGMPLFVPVASAVCRSQHYAH
jgi:hypothetical protein